jgi:hypothetical protein
VKDKKDEKWLDRMISQAADFGKVEFNAQQWKQKYLLEKSRDTLSSRGRLKPQKTIWRSIMESKVTRYSAAAVMVLAMTLVLLGPFGTPGNGGVVLADVQQKVTEIDTMILRGQKTLLRPGKDGDVFEFDGVKAEVDVVKYHSKQHGYVEEGYVGDSLFYRATFNLPKRQTLLVFPAYKKYVTFPSTDKQAQLLETLPPNGIVDLLVGSDYKELGRDNIDGVEAQCFEFQTIESFKNLLPKPVLHMQDFKGKVWIGIEEQLPVRLEAELSIGKSLMTMFNDLILHEVNVLDEYNIAIDEDIFDIEPPEGYTEITLSDIIRMIPVEAKAGLAGLGIIPAGLIFWRRRKRKRAAASRN